MKFLISSVSMFSKPTALKRFKYGLFSSNSECDSVVFLVNFEQILHIVLVFLLLTLNK